MTNFEFYVDEIIKKLEAGTEVCTAMETLALLEHVNAEILRAAKCADRGCSDCWAEVLEILKQEHVEQPKVTKRERAFLELVGSGWIARDREGELYYYNQEPQKSIASWCGVPTRALTRIDDAICLYFEFIKWDEDEPRKVEDLLQLEVQENG